MSILAHRSNGYQHLSGIGLEIGALHEPAPLPKGATVSYFDAIDENEARKLFPEIPPESFVHVSFKGDLDNDGLTQFADGQFDFVVINHVMEHLSNPIKAVREVFRITKPGGCTIIAIPDKEYTFDRHRSLTPFEHLQRDYADDVRESDDTHYLDFLRSAAPHVFKGSPDDLAHHVERARTRREHAHVWTSATFKHFLEESMRSLGIKADLLFESHAAANQIECFTAWRKRK